MRALPIFAFALAALLAAAAGATEYTIQPGPEGEDTSPYSFVPSVPRGQHLTLYAFRSLDDDGIAHEFETYLKFPLPTIDSDEDVIEATVWIDYAFDFDGFGDPSELPAEIHCHEVLEAWTEAGLTWANRPDIGSAFDVTTGIDEHGPIACDVTELVQDWLSGAKTNRGLALTNPTERVIGMYSWEDTGSGALGHQARLVIETTGTVTADLDSDGIADDDDNCPDTPNTLQQDTEGDAVGDACDVCPTIFDPAQADTNDDGRGDACGKEAADLDDDGFVTKLDRKLFKATSKKNATYRADCDLNGDEVVSKQDGVLWNPIYKEFLVKKPPQ